MYIHTFIGTLSELSTSPSNDAQQHVRDDLLKDGVLDIGLADRRNLQSTYPKIANLIQILYIVCRALGCFQGGSCERFAIDVIRISSLLHAGPDLTDARP